MIKPSSTKNTQNKNIQNQNIQNQKYKKFEELGISTQTIMVYSNIQFNIPVLFKKLPITHVSVPLTKKRKLPDMKKVTAPFGCIISLRHKNAFRGIITKPDMLQSDQRGTYFLNQVTCVLSLGNKNLHIMIFNNKLKIVGNKDIDHAIRAVEILWSYIKQIKSSYTLADPDTAPNFVFDSVMTNVDFKLGFKIDRRELNNLMNSPEFSDFIHLSRFETTNSTNVNIKMYAQPPSNLSFRAIDIIGDKTIKKFVSKNPYEIKKEGKKKYTTFLVFRSSKVIESGRFEGSMKHSYEKFLNIIKNNRDKIEEKIQKTTIPYVHKL